MDKIIENNEAITVELLSFMDKTMRNLACNAKIAGFDQDDLMQEMRIKIWETVRDNKFNPEIVLTNFDGLLKSFFYKTCKNHLLRLREKSLAKLRRDWDSPDTFDDDSPEPPDSLVLELMNECKSTDELERLNTLFF